MISRLKISHILIAFVFILSAQTSVAQCFQIESILVDACDTGADEGLNEMVRFKVGPTALNTSTLSVTWPNNAWTGLIQNAVTASKVATLNAQVAAAGGCAQILEPVGGVLPANAEVILITSQNFGVAANIFGAITQNIYVIFQNNPAVTVGHFANYNATPGIRTLTMNFGACSDTVSYDRSLLINTNGTAGGSAAIQNGATVNYTNAGAATYVNTGCVAPVDIFTVEAGNTPITACPGSTISLAGTAVGAISSTWSAASGTFSTPGSLTSGYTIPVNASGAITLTLTATNSCGNNISDTVIVNVSATVVPTFSAVPAICSGAILSALPLTSNNGITGSWSPALNNTNTTIYTFTPNPGQCATITTLTINVNQPATPIFAPVAAICSGSTLAALPTTSLNGITGTWSPVLNNATTTIYTFTPNAGQCATSATLTITVNPGNTIPLFNAVGPICSGSALSALPTTSTNGISGVWSPAINNAATTTYTFTPAAGQCAVSATLTIVVNSVVTPTFGAVTPICSGSALAPLPTTSLNGVTGNWSPALNNMATTTYTFTPTAGQCALTTSLTITVNTGTIPTFNSVAAICSGEFLAPLPTTSLNGISGTWSPALNNMATTTYTFTPLGLCNSNSTLTITVNPASAIPTFNINPAICLGTVLLPFPTTSINGITGSWSPAPNNTTSTTYTFTPDAGQCAAPTAVEVAVQNGFDFTVNGACVGQNFIFNVSEPTNLDLGTATFEWTNSSGLTVGTNAPNFDVSAYVNSTPETETYPLNLSLAITSSAGCTVTKPLVVERIYCDIQKGISPNGDLKNEFFDLSLLGVQQLNIFNRYGTKVYSKANYTNQWSGQSANGEKLPDGTYYYVIDFGTGTKSKTGWIYINK